MATYDPAQVKMTLGGVEIHGIVDGTFLEVAYEEDQWSYVAGADGEALRIKRNDNRATATVHLKHDSESNFTLSAAMEAGLEVPLLVQDLNGNSLVAGLFTVDRVPLNRGQEETDVAWPLRSGNAVIRELGYGALV
jgi:hypothetical protein